MFLFTLYNMQKADKTTVLKIKKLLNKPETASKQPFKSKTTISCTLTKCQHT